MFEILRCRYFISGPFGQWLFDEHVPELIESIKRETKAMLTAAKSGFDIKNISHSLNPALWRLQFIKHDLDIVKLIISWKWDRHDSQYISLHRAYNLNDAILMKLLGEIGFDEDRLWRYKVHRDETEAVFEYVAINVTSKKIKMFSI